MASFVTGKTRILALLEDLSLYDNESCNEPRDFAALVKAISLPQDVPSTSDGRLIELENQVQRLMEAHLAPKQPTQVNKVTSSCEICSGPYDTQYCMEDPEQAFVEYASLCTDETGVYLSSNPVQHQHTKHIEIDIHFVRDLVAAGQVRVLHVPSRYQYAEIFTKGLPSVLFEEFRTSLSVRACRFRVGRRYRAQPNGVLSSFDYKREIGSLHTQRLALRYSVDYSSSDHFTSYYSSQDFPSDSLLETSSDSHSNTSFDSSSRHSSSYHPISDSPCDSPTTTSARPSRMRHRGGFLPYIPREIGLGVDVEDNYEPYTEPDIDLDVQADVDACIAFVDDIEARGTDVRVEIRTAAEEEAKSSARGIVEIGVDRVTHPVVLDDVAETIRGDFPELVSVDGSLKVT
ncbi:MAK10-like protein [Tanacetum coccineum]